ncbi:MAG: DUF488 family protein [Armatimonadota bacterium]|nr:DUF488 family protein [Armatimonadota bacterium]MDR5702882.1 DUF488 family protein [Armatimonadota bacterium]
MPVQTKRVYDAASPEDGTRILVMRLYPRGVKREAFHAWYKELGTAPELIKAWKGKRLRWEEFARRYEAQIEADPQAQARVEELARRARSETITLLCTCEDEEYCHRSVLKRIIERRMKTKR